MIASDPLTWAGLLALIAILISLMGLVASLFNRSGELRERVARLEQHVFNGRPPGRPDGR